MSYRLTTATGTGNIATTVAPSDFWALNEVRVHLSAAGAANRLTVTIDANAGAAYDTLLYTQDMTLITNLVWQPDQPIILQGGDKITVAWTNGSSRTYGLEIVWTDLPG